MRRISQSQSSPRHDGETLTGMNQVNPKKLLDSKWTAVSPVNREKHFVVTRTWWEKPGKLGQIEVEAVLTGTRRRIEWRELKDSARWRIGWQ